jgi:hypothetical protein
MAHRIPQIGDRVKVRESNVFYAGDRGVVVASEPERASQHRCTVRFDDGGEDQVESASLTILTVDADTVRAALKDDPFVTNADFGQLVEEQAAADEVATWAAEVPES